MGPLPSQSPPLKDRTSQEDDETTLLLGYGGGLRGIGEVHGSDPAIPSLQTILANNASLERDLVRRLDLFLLTFGCISQGKLQFPASVHSSNHFISYQVGPPHGTLPMTTWTHSSRYLDQTNISSAYVSGMQEDLHLDGNELN